MCLTVCFRPAAVSDERNGRKHTICWSVILADHGVPIAFHLALALAAVLAALYAIARAAGLADLGRRVDLAERSVRRGEGDPELARALTRDAEGDWE